MCHSIDDCLLPEDSPQRAVHHCQHRQEDQENSVTGFQTDGYLNQSFQNRYLAAFHSQSNHHLEVQVEFPSLANLDELPMDSGKYSGDSVVKLADLVMKLADSSMGTG